MNRIGSRSLACLCAIGTLLVFTGCGSLRQRASFSGLSQEAMSFVDAQPTGGPTYTIQVGREKYEGTQGANYVVPAIPFWFWKTLVKVDDEYCLSRWVGLIPVYVSGEVGVFDKDGHPTQLLSANSLAAGINLVTFLRHKEGINSASPTDAYAVKFLYGLLGFGTEYFQLFWIPFKTPDSHK